METDWSGSCSTKYRSKVDTGRDNNLPQFCAIFTSNIRTVILFSLSFIFPENELVSPSWRNKQSNEYNMMMVKNGIHIQ